MNAPSLCAPPLLQERLRAAEEAARRHEGDAGRLQGELDRLRGEVAGLQERQRRGRAAAEQECRAAEAALAAKRRMIADVFGEEPAG